VSEQQQQQTQQQALEVRPERPAVIMHPQTVREAMDFAKLLSDSDLVPKDYKGKPGNIVAALQYGSEVGLPPMAALKSIAVINGRASLWGDGAIAVVMTHPAYEWHQEMDVAAIDKAGAATFTIKRRGQPKPHTVTYTVELAKKAHLWGKQGPWTDHPARMLQLRARGWALRDVFPDALAGLSLAEESLDSGPIGDDGIPARAKNVTSACTLQDVLEAIRSAVDQPALTAVSALAMQLQPEEQAQAREAYKARLNELRKAQTPPKEGKHEVGKQKETEQQAAPADEEPPCDPKTGEVIEQPANAEQQGSTQGRLGW